MAMNEHEMERKIREQEIEILLLKDQLKCAMCIAFGVPYEKSERLIKYADFYRMRYARGEGATEGNPSRDVYPEENP